jgi:hypothetical protein
VHSRFLACCLAAAAYLACAGLAAAANSGTRDRPPPAHTGGFGEPSCQSCHSDRDADEGSGQLRVLGLPDRFRAGETYDLVVELTDDDMRAAGFQLAARFDDATQAGVLAPADSAAGRTAVTTADAIAFAHHLYPGTHAEPGQPARWRLRWTAPASGRPVTFHAAAVAADDDLSPLGDLVYTARRQLAPQH